MKNINSIGLSGLPVKKSVSSIFFIAFLITLSFVLASKANFLFAQSTTTDTCSFNVSLSSSTAPSQNVSPGQGGVPLVKFNVVPSCAVTLNSFTVSLMPASSGYQNISFLKLFREGMQIGAVSTSSSSNLTFTGLNMQIFAGQTMALEVKGDISSSAIGGSTVYGAFGGFSATASSGSPIGENINSIVIGNIMTITRSTVDTVSPSAPTGLVATKDDYNEVDLSWTVSTDNIGIAGYEVWRNTGGTWSRIGQASNHTYIDTTVSSSTGYYYKIIAYDAAGNKSSPSSQLFLNTPANSSNTANTLTPTSTPVFTLTPTPIPTPTPTPTITITPHINAWIDGVSTSSTYTYPFVINGIKNATLTSNFSLTNPTFYLKKISSSGVVESVNYYTSSVANLSLVSGSMGMSWNGTINTANLTNGTYKFYAVGLYGTATISSNYVYFKAENGTITPTVTPTITQVPTINNTSESASPTFTPTSIPTSVLTPTPTITVTPYAGIWMDGVQTSSTYVSPTLVSGIKIAGLNSNFSLTNPAFYLKKISSTGTVETVNYYTSTVANISLVSGSMGMSWNGTINTANLTNGTYKFYAAGLNGATPIISNYIYFKVENITVTPTVSQSPTISPTPAITKAPSFIINAWIEGVPANTATYIAINGVKKVFAYGYDSANPDILLSGLSFRLYDVKSSSYITSAPVATSGDGNKNWAGTFDTSKFSTGNYVFSAKGWYINKENITEYFYSNSINIYIDNSVATTPAPSATPVDFYIQFVENYSSQVFSGDKKIAVVSSLDADNVTFYIQGAVNKEIAAIKIDSKNYYFLWNTKDFPDGPYTITAKAMKGISVAFKSLDVKIANSTANPSFTPTVSRTTAISPVPTIAVTEDCRIKGFLTSDSCQKYMAIPLLCREKNILDEIKCKEYIFNSTMPEDCIKLGITSQEQCREIIMVKSFPIECRNANIITSEDCTNFMSNLSGLSPECKEANITIADECTKYMEAKYMPKECLDLGIKTKEECDYALRSKYEGLNNLVVIETAPNSMEEIGTFLKECQEKGISSKEDCEKYIMSKQFPQECQAANIIDKDACEKLLFTKNAPEECVKAGVTTIVECEKIIFKNNAPKECLDAGISNPEACKKIMFEKYNNGGIASDDFPVECKKAGVKTSVECKKIMTQKYLPEACKSNGITDTEQCNVYLTKKYFPKECQDAGVTTLSECNKTMFKKYAPDECKKAGINDEKKCKDFMFNIYSPKVTCGKLDEWQCKNSIKDNHLGTIVAAQTQFNKIKEEASSLAGKSFKSADIREKIPSASNIMPIKDKDAGFKIVQTKSDILLSETNDIVQTAPVAVMIDSDSDGLPDDMEKRLGTDIFKADTDGDGYSDGDELKGGYDPKGPDKLTEKISPIDEAIIQNKILSQPKAEGKESENLTISKIDNIDSGKKDKKNGYSFSGKAEPNSVITLYVYSDLPVVMTVKTDEDGNWKYELSNSLADGEHEVYVAVNDNAGKVVAKSNPLSFFVKEAKAVSVKEFVAPVFNDKPAAYQKSMYNYWIMVTLLIVAAVFVVTIFIIKKRRRTV